MTHLWPTMHATDQDRGLIIEIYHPTRGLIGAIYPTENGVKIVSKHFNPHVDAHARFDPVAPPALEVNIV
jgi:hypothetical protein